MAKPDLAAIMTDFKVNFDDGMEINAAGRPPPTPDSLQVSHHEHKRNDSTHSPQTAPSYRETGALINRDP